jgi:hypothetical protein
MNQSALRILGRVARRGEMPLYEVIRMSHKSGGDHRNQYPLALILEEHYLGMTINYAPPEGFDRMREFALAITLHMYMLPADSSGIVSYQGVRSSGGLDPQKERVFLTAKGALYIDEYWQKRWDRVWSVALGFTTGILVALGAAWAKTHFRW